MIVVDASALLEVLLNTPTGKLISSRLRGEKTLHAPHLLDLEVSQVLRRYVQNGNLEAERASASLDALADWRITRYPHHSFISRIWELLNNLTAYDAVYVALAEILDATLLTCDAALASAPGHHARVEVVQYNYRLCVAPWRATLRRGRGGLCGSQGRDGARPPSAEDYVQTCPLGRS